MTDEEDFWDAVDPAVKTYGIRRGRYHFPPPPGAPRPPRGSYMRMTNLAAAISDQVRLQKWRERMILLGLREDEGLLFDELAVAPLENMAPDDVKEWLEEHAARAADRAGAGVGARRGTARHTMLQTYLETGVVTGHRMMRLQLSSLFEALDRHDLEPVAGWAERRVCNVHLGVIGTLDMRVRCLRTGQEGVLDLKTQRSFWSYLEISGQQQGYDSAEWYWEGPEDGRGEWLPMPPNTLLGAEGGPAEGKRVALLAHMPKEPGPDQLPVEIHEVDLTYGAEVMEQALRNVELRSRGASVAKGRAVGGKRPLPKIRAQVLAPSAIARVK